MLNKTGKMLSPVSLESNRAVQHISRQFQMGTSAMKKTKHNGVESDFREDGLPQRRGSGKICQRKRYLLCELSPESSRLQRAFQPGGLE